MIPCRSAFVRSFLILCTFSTTYQSSVQTEFVPSVDFVQKMTERMSVTVFEHFLGFAGDQILHFITRGIDIQTKPDSPEIIVLRRLYNETNVRFDVMDLKLNDLKREINWKLVKFEYGELERKVKSNRKYLQNFFDAKETLKDSQKDYFLNSFENSCTTCALDLYFAIVGENGEFNSDIFSVAATSFKNDRMKTQELMLGVLRLLTYGIENELAFRKFKYGDENYFHTMKDWATKMPKVTAKLREVNIDIMNKCQYQYQIDVDETAISLPTNKASNKKFAEVLFNKLAEKYDWRDWLVIVYKPVSGDLKHAVSDCGGYKRFQTNGRNIIVTSVNQTNPFVNMTVANLTLFNIKTTYNECTKNVFKQIDRFFKNGHFPDGECVNVTKKRNAKEIFAMLPPEFADCDQYCSVGVIDSWVDLWYLGKQERLVHRQTPGVNSYSIHIFG